MNVCIDNKESIRLKRTLYIGFALRLLLLITILLLPKVGIEPYFISDDIKYESHAITYIRNASSLFDGKALAAVIDAYMQPFWPLVTCLLAYAFRSIYAGRFLNIILSTACIKLIYNITLLISGKSKPALKAARIFAYLPLTLFTCCFPIKDIFIMYGVLYAFYVFLMVQNHKKVKIIQFIWCALLLIGVYFSRGAVTEFLLILFGVYIAIGFAKSKKYWSLAVTILVFIAFIIIFGNRIYEAFFIKVEDYGGDTGLGNGIRYVQINGITDIYKLPFTYFFATLQPITLNLLKMGRSSLWLTIITNLNVSIYPIATGNFIYIFFKKRNRFFWWSTFIFYSAVIILSIGVFRHYLFLLPVQIINYSLCTDQNKDAKPFSFLAAAALLILVLFLSLV